MVAENKANQGTLYNAIALLDVIQYFSLCIGRIRNMEYIQ